jgi:Platelet-activating factor acetylhydrolase, isoform II
MLVARYILTLALLFPATLAQAAGFRFIEVPAGAEGTVPLTGAMWSPCSQPTTEVDLGDITLPGVKDCPIAGDKLPLVVISHGRGGSFVGHHDIAETLADAGFVVAAINHPGDTASDLSRSDDLSVFIERPTEIKHLIDFIIGASPAASKLDPDRIGLFGFSRAAIQVLCSSALIRIGPSPRPIASNHQVISASKSTANNIPHSHSPMTCVPKPLSSSTRSPCCLPQTAFKGSKCRSNSGRRSVAATA